MSFGIQMETLEEKRTLRFYFLLGVKDFIKPGQSLLRVGNKKKGKIMQGTREEVVKYFENANRGVKYPIL